MTRLIFNYQLIFCTTLVGLCSFGATLPVDTNQPIVRLECTPGVACITRYGAVLPQPFNRTDGGSTSTYGDTNATNVPGFEKLNDYPFLSFDDRFLNLLGTNATYQYFFTVANTNHEGPVWIENKNWILFSELNQFWQYKLDLSSDVPSLSRYTANPPIWSPAGGSYHDGLVYFANIGGPEQIPALVSYNPETNEAKTILNNYRGLAFNGPDDLIIDPNGNIWWTDPWFGYLDDLNPVPPVLTTGVWFFNATSGSSKLLDGTLSEPNGIVSSPDWSTIYVSDTGVNSGKPPTFHPTGPRTLYAYDVDLSIGSLENKRTFYINEQHDPDGLKVDSRGNLWTASGKGVDVVDPTGNLLGRVQTNFTVSNLVFAGQDLQELWLVGRGGVSRVQLHESGKPVIKR